MNTRTAIYTRYTNDPRTSEHELHTRSGQLVDVLEPLDPETYDIEEVGQMFNIRFADGYEDIAFADELQVEH